MTSTHGAAPTALGYFYQIDWAFVELLRSAPGRPDHTLSLETLDDVAWDRAGDPVELLQVKHHVNHKAILSDKSIDVWKTVQIWLDTPTALDSSGPTLTLVTTAAAAEHSAMSFLRRPPETRNPAAALELLDAAANSSTAKATAKTRKAWLELDESVRLGVLSRAIVFDASVRMDGLNEAAEQQLVWAIPPDHTKTFLDLVWRWWHNVAMDLLQGRRRAVGLIEVRRAVADIRSTFASDNLPTLIQLRDVDTEALAAAHDQHTFVHQLRWVDVDLGNIQRSIVDYYRAVSHTTRWIEESLIDTFELEAFQDSLKDEWSRLFDDMIADLPAHASDGERQQVGRDLFRALRNATSIAIRDRFQDPFLARGLRHSLADRGDLGWHPEFEGLLRQLLLGTSSGMDES